MNTTNAGSTIAETSSVAITSMTPTTMLPTTMLPTTMPPTTVPPTTVPPTTMPPTTSTPCTSTDNCDGHYTCEPDTFLKVCMSGYSGTDCKTRSFSGSGKDTQCPPGNINGCLNNGHCFNESCCCEAMYEGTYCQSDVVVCMSSPCQYGGSCMDNYDSYTCLCPPGYYYPAL